jgi:hypothetical protein
MFDDPNGPIEHFEWGRYIISGKKHAAGKSKQVGAGKDIRLIGEEVTEWQERKGHLLTPEMVTGVYQQGIQVLVIGIGVDGALQCPEEVKRSILNHGIGEVITALTPEACRLYNMLYHQGRHVALLAHGTC